MLKYILKRLGLSVLILLGVSLIIYVLIRCMPVSFIDDKIAQMNQGGATIPQETIDSEPSSRENVSTRAKSLCFIYNSFPYGTATAVMYQESFTVPLYAIFVTSL